MINRAQIQQYATAIAARFSPQRIVLFGSYANGSPGPDSDVDLLVVMPHPRETWHQAAEIMDVVPPPFPLDLLVRSPETLEYRMALGDPFLKTIISEGHVLYESTRH